MRIVMMFALLSTVSAPAFADEVKVQVQADAAAKPKVVCRRFTPIGSNIPGKKVCVAKKDYDAQLEASRQTTKDMTNNPGASSSR